MQLCTCNLQQGGKEEMQETKGHVNLKAYVLELGPYTLE